MNQADLDRVNGERRKRGSRALTIQDARTALSRRPVEASHSGDGAVLGSHALDYLIGLQGIPLPSAGGMMGYALSPSYSSDSGPSSTDSDSSSSSSSDSGSSSSSGGE